MILAVTYFRMMAGDIIIMNLNFRIVVRRHSPNEDSILPEWKPLTDVLFGFLFYHNKSQVLPLIVLLR
jgi:hypothetical protein